MSKRGLNTSALMVGPDVIVTHSEENVSSSEMGMVAALPANLHGALTDKDARWIVRDIQAGYASPVSDGERIYIVDNGGVLLALNVKDGSLAWRKNLGTVQKSSPVLADGKMYVGTESGKFYVLKVGAAGAEIVDEDELPPSSDGEPEHIIASPAVARGRVYLTSMDATYAIGPKTTPASASTSTPMAAPSPATSNAPAATILVTPTQVVLKPGESVKLTIRAFDEHGVALATPPQATWTLEGLKGTLANGTFTADAANVAQAGVVKATAGAVSGAAGIRVFPPLPWSWNFDTAANVPAEWVNTTGKFTIKEVDGNKALAKLTENPFAFAKRCRPFFSGPDLSDYTIEADVRQIEKRRQRGDVGVVAQRYEMVLFGNHQRLELQPWQPEVQRTVRVDFPWKTDTWYTMKLEVQGMGEGKVRARGKVWEQGQPEPTAWTIERIDPIGSVKGAPGLYADAPSQPGGGSDIYYDNIKVYKNK